MKLLIVSGRSGSGKSISLHVLEDLGYYCIDNLPASLLPQLITHVGSNYSELAIGIDARNLPYDLDQFNLILDDLKNAGVEVQIIYLDADDNTLLKRFSETRRKHPLSNANVSLQEAIQNEKLLLEPIAHLADLRVDTSQYNMHQLCELITARINKHPQQLSLLIQSFGYKFGVPPDSDFIFDVRCLPNPYWLPELRPLTGLAPKIQDFIASKPETQLMLEHLKKFFQTWIPYFESSNRNYMKIAIGCTGGQHRSVFIAEKLAEFLRQSGKDIQLRHREII